jgi:hypothetical protein
MLRYWFVILAAVVGCSSSGDGAVVDDEQGCQSINEQICQKWAEESVDPGKPCDPPQITGTTDYTGACEAADKKCATPATALSCPGSG